MTRTGVLVLVLSAVAWLAPPAHARDWNDWSYGPLAQAQGDRSKKRAGPPPQRGERQRQPQPEKQGQKRLTQEERRDLNRDLDRANREIYRRR
jgi:hypothetical protein